MIELSQLVAAHAELAARRQPCVLATVVQTSGSSYRRPGARMLMAEGAQLAGAISGGCLEGDLMRKAWWHTSAGPCLVRYDATIDDGDDIRWGFGLGCNGIVDVLLERLEPGQAGDPIAFIARCLATRQPGVLATVIAAPASSQARVGQRLLVDEKGLAGGHIGDAALAAEVRRAALAARTAGRSQLRDHGGVRVFVELIAPPPSLLVCGGGYDVVPLVQQAKAIGWHVVVVDGRARPALRQRVALADELVIVPDAAELPARLPLTARTAAVVMSHDYERDRALVDALLPSAVGYLGVLGPRARTERMLAELQALGRPAGSAERTRLHAPVGIDLGAEGADEIALAIVAEAQSVLAQRTARSLRDLPPAAKSPPLTSAPQPQPLVCSPDAP